MLWALIKKELLLFLRNPQELLLLLGMPILLITILGFALGSWMDAEAPLIEGKVAIIEYTSETEELAHFLEQLDGTSMPSEVKGQIKERSREFLPIMKLKKEVFGQKELQDFIILEELTPAQLNEAKKDNQYSAIIEVPEGFTSEMLQAIFTDEQLQTPKLKLFLNEGNAWSAGIVEDVLRTFQEQYSILAGLGREQLLDEATVKGKTDVYQSVETLTKKEPIKAIGYYAVGMSVMFVLFIASTIGSLSYVEKESRIFDRILLANVPKGVYMGSIFCSTILLAFLQLIILYAGVALLYGIRWPNIPAFLLVTIALCGAVGGISLLLVSLTFRLNSNAASSFFTSVIVAIFSFIGGSFTPLGNISKGLQTIGQFTPNGAGMAAYLKLLQGYAITDVSQHIWTLFGFMIVMISAAVILFPKGREAS